MTVRRLLMLAAVGSLLATPAQAQPITPQDNLDCAIWAAVAGGASQDEKFKNVLAIALGWFIGQYEGQTGKLIDDELEQGVRNIDDAKYQASAGVCMARLGGFGQRLANLGSGLSKDGQ